MFLAGRESRVPGVGVSGAVVTDLGLGNLLGVRLAQVPHRHDVVVSVIHHHQLVSSVLYVTEKKNTDYFSTQQDSITQMTKILVIAKKDKIQS